MIEAFRDYGKLTLLNQKKDQLDLFVEDPKISNYPYTIVIEIIENDTNKFDFIGTSIEETSEEYDKYLFRGGSSRGANFTPTAKVTTLSNTLDQKVLGWFRSTLKKKDISNYQWFEAIYQILKEKIHDIEQDISAKINDKERYLITLKINDQYLKNIPAFVDIFIQLVNEKDLELNAKEQVCSLCNELKSVVLGKVSVFKFFTIDKPGFITGGFQENLAWRNYPVCLDCRTYLEEGRNQIEKNLKFNFYGMSYLLIPKFLFDPTEFSEEYEDILYIFSDQLKKNIKLSKEHEDNITGTEDEILSLLADQNDIVMLNLLFLQRAQGAERILLLIEDVLPSRLQHIFKAKRRVDQLISFSDNKNFHLGRIRTFFSKSDSSKRNDDLNKYFLEIVDSVFKLKKLRFQFLTKFMMKELRKSFIDEDGSWVWKSMNAVSTILFFEHLGILPLNKNFTIGGIDVSDFPGLDIVFEKYGKQLNTSEKKGIFLLGVLTQMLLDYQFVKRSSQPFKKQLMGLKMNENKMRGLLPQVINKFQEYQIYGSRKKKLAEMIADLLESSPSKWKMSIDEMNFHFVCGMSLKKQINEIIGMDKEEEEHVESAV